MEILIQKGFNTILNNISNIISSAKKQGRILTTYKKVNSGVFHDLNSNGKAGLTPNFPAPLNDSDRFDQLASSVEGYISTHNELEEQVNAGIIKAETLGFRKPIVGVVARKVVLDFNKGKSKEELKSDCGNFLCY